MEYNWQLPGWRNFSYDEKAVEKFILAFAEKAGYVNGVVGTLGESFQLETIIELLVAEAMKTSAIEGEYMNRKDVVSSIKINLGLVDEYAIKDQRAIGVGKLMVMVRNTYHEPLNKETLFSWHKTLMGFNEKIITGDWRKGSKPMQIISGSYGKVNVHFEAPPSKLVPQEMELFIKWFNDTALGCPMEIKSGPIRAAIAHLYFESIHPFEDGNGRIGRAISEKALSQNLGRPVMLSLSQAIESNKEAFYKALKNAQRTNEVTAFLKYFCKVTLEAQEYAEELVTFVLQKARFFDQYQKSLNPRQKKVLARMWAEGPTGFQGGMSAKKYISIAKTSKATATRDLAELVLMGALYPIGEGRARKYQLNFSNMKVK